MKVGAHQSMSQSKLMTSSNALKGGKVFNASKLARAGGLVRKTAVNNQ